MNDFIEHQSYIISLTKQETALIEASTSANGNVTFDLPSNLKSQEGVKKTRKDSYSALLLGAYGIKCYLRIVNLPKKQKSTFKPTFIG